MEDIGDILFYLIAAIIGIAGAIANKKKKKEQSQVPQSEADEIDDTIFEQADGEAMYDVPEEMKADTRYEMITDNDLEYMDSDPFDYIEEDPNNQSIIMDPEKEGNYNEPMAGEFSLEGGSITEQQITKTELGKKSEMSLDQNASWGSTLLDDFDLAKAIIYSEVLNRKDFV